MFDRRVSCAISLSDAGLCRTFGWEVQSHRFKVAMAADLVALWHNGRITVDRGPG